MHSTPSAPTPSAPTPPTPAPAPFHVDVLIVGAGLSGIGAAYHLTKNRPGHTYAIVEARDRLGGTWDLFRYPGVRSDSDLHTLGYAFRPWRGEKAIAGGDAIRDYIRATADENGITPRIRFGLKVLGAEWSSRDARWTVHAEHRATAEPVVYTCRFLFAATGYYDYDRGHSPVLPGSERFTGRIVHPQHWPQDADHTGKRVVVIGSGATGVTLVPAMAQRAEHVTLLQRSPSYVLPVPSRDRIADALMRVLGRRIGYRVVRRKNIATQAWIYRISRGHPQLVRRLLRTLQRRMLPAGYDLATHFTPRYEPWDQRLCLVPDGDLFTAIASGRASVVTDRIGSVEEHGIRLAGGALLRADVIVTATGLNLLAFGGIRLSVDGREVALPRTTVYKGAMLGGVPNFAFAVGYTNASWTLKVDLVCEYLCRVLAHLDTLGVRACVPLAAEPVVGERPLMDFAAGYVQRSIADFPRQGSAEPWTMNMDYRQDVRLLRHAPVDDGVLRFANPVARLG